jgi:hypothetical protein
MPPFFEVNEGRLPVPDAAKPIAVLLLTQLKLTVPVKGLLNVIAWVVVLRQAAWSATVLTVAVGLTVMVKVVEVPVQVTPPFEKEGVTVIVAVIGELVLFIAVKDGIPPVPPDARPILLLSFDQL